MINAANLSKFGQACLSLGIRVVAVGAVAGVEYLLKIYTTFGLPDPVLTVPLLGGVLAEADTWLVKWENSVVPQ